MNEGTARRDGIDVDDIMRQIRARVRERHGADYTDAELRQLANARLEKLLNPTGGRTDLVAELRRRASPGSVTDFSEAALFDSRRGWLRGLRRLLRPVLKLFINPGAFSRAMQARQAIDGLIYEVVERLVVEQTRLDLEVHNLKMRVEALAARVDFDERRAKAYADVPPSRPISTDRGRPPARGPQPPRGPQVGAGTAPAMAAAPAQAAPATPSAAGPADAPQSPTADGARPDAGALPGGGEPRRRRRRRRRRRGGGLAGAPGSSGVPGGAGPSDAVPAPGSSVRPAAADDRGPGDDGGSDDWDDNDGDDGGADDQDR